MAYFAWVDDLSVGNQFIDEDHKKLIRLINDFHEAMEQGRGNAAIGTVLDELIRYTKEHFRREEAEMQRIAYPRLMEHRQEHEKLVDEIVGLQRSVENGEAMLSIKVSKFLRDWLCDHIIRTDRPLSEALRKSYTAST